MENIIVYELGGPGTYCKRGFVHLSCVPAQFQNYKKEQVSMDRYRRVLPVAEAKSHSCMLCRAILTETTSPV